MIQENLTVTLEDSELEAMEIINGYLASQKISTLKSNGFTNRSQLIREALRLAVEAISSKAGTKKPPTKPLIPAPKPFKREPRTLWNRPAQKRAQTNSRPE